MSGKVEQTRLITETLLEEVVLQLVAVLMQSNSYMELKNIPYKMASI